MPTVVVKGKAKKFPYTKKGEKEAKKEAKKEGGKVMMNKRMMHGKKTKYTME